MFEIGRVVVKISGRDSGNYAAVVDKIDDKFVLIEGNVRRKKCNIKHLEPLDILLKINKSAAKDDVLKAMKAAKINAKKVNKKKFEKKNIKK